MPHLHPFAIYGVARCRQSKFGFSGSADSVDPVARRSINLNFVWNATSGFISNRHGDVRMPAYWPYFFFARGFPTLTDQLAWTNQYDQMYIPEP
jgi:hypothetical protein